MNETFRTDVVDGLIGVAYYEEDASNPQKDWDPFGEILYAKRSRYVLGGRAVDSDEMREIAEDPNNIVLPVYAYVHGGSTISTGAFSCQWDSGQSGYVWISKADALSQLGKKRLTTKTREKILENLRGTVRTFAMFLEGDVYDLRVYRVDENGDIDESDIVIGNGTDVFSIDGYKLGRVDELTFDDEGKITGFAFEQGHIFGRKDVDVAIDDIDGVTSKYIRLKLTKDALEAK